MSSLEGSHVQGEADGNVGAVAPEVEGTEGAVGPEAEGTEWLATKPGEKEDDAVKWMRQCSKHLSHLEHRKMEEAFLGHEVVRQMMQIWEQFSPPPRGDWGWILRKALDYGVRALRNLVRLYHAGQSEDMSSFVLRATKMVRLYYEESFVRSLMGVEGDTDEEKNLRKSALCSLAVTLGNIEGATLGSNFMGKRMFVTFTEANVRALALNEVAGEYNSLEQLPSFNEAMSNADMAHEVFSLMPVRVHQQIVLSKREVRALIDQFNERPLPESVSVPGLAGDSPFAEVFGVQG